MSRVEAGDDVWLFSSADAISVVLSAIFGDRFDDES
jgi:hypothetical protein